MPRHRDTPNAVLALLDCAVMQRDLGRRPQMRGLALDAVGLMRRWRVPASKQLELGL